MTMTAAMMLATSACTTPEKAVTDESPIIGRQEITIADGRLTPEALWAMGRIGSSNVSPDGTKIAYTVSYYSVKENKSHLVIYVMNADGTNNTLLTEYGRVLYGYQDGYQTLRTYDDNGVAVDGYIPAGSAVFTQSATLKDSAFLLTKPKWFSFRKSSMVNVQKMFIRIWTRQAASL